MPAEPPSGMRNPPGMVPRCAKVGDPAIHKGCKLAKMFKAGEAATDSALPDRARGWMPVAGRDDVCIHFAVLIPES